MSGDDDIFASLGGSLMDDLLSDINAATGAGAAAAPSSTGGGGDDGDDDALASLERELAAFTTGDEGDGGGAGNPPGMGAPPPGLLSGFGPPPPQQHPSAAAFVVGHAAERSVAANMTSAPPPGVGSAGGGGGDAWAASMANFGALGMTDDFLAADTAKKQHKTSSAPSSGGLPPGLNLAAAAAGALDDYDVEETVKLAGSSAAPQPGGPPGMLSPAALKAEAPGPAEGQRGAGGPPGVGGPSPQGGPNGGPPGQGPPPPGHMGMPHPFPGPHGVMPPGMRPGMPFPQGAMPPGVMPPGGGMMFPPGAMPPGAMPPGAMMGMMPPGAAMPPGALLPGMMGMPPPGGPLPPGMMGMPPGAMGMPPPPGAQQHQHQHQQGLPPPPSKGEHAYDEKKKDELRKETQKKSRSKSEDIAFKKKDFPELGKETKAGDDEDKDDEDSDEAGDEPVIPFSKGPDPLPEPEPERSSMAELQSVHTRLLFNNPAHHAEPINATRVKSSLMNARDICYVVHSYMRPLVSLDAYNDDYYRWGYDDRKSRNLLVLGGGPGPGGPQQDLPNPVWKEEKIKAAKMEDKYRTTVEKRSKDWGAKQQVLGRHVKVNVRRPRALLATDGALTSKLHEEDNQDTDDSQSADDEHTTPEERIRARLWSARLAVDRGYNAYLGLVELRRLLQSNDPAIMRGRKREELTDEVEGNIERLHSALGVRVTVPTEEDAKREITVNGKALARTLSLPKGRMLLSRVLDEAVLPHSSACRVLPAAVGAVLRTPPSESGVNPGAMAGAPPRGEDRMLRSLAGLVRTVRPSVAPRDALECLDEVGRVHADLTAAAKKRGDGSDGAKIVKSMLGGQRARMELLHSVLSRGNEICLAPDGSDEGEYSEEWRTKEGEFMTLLSSARG